MAMSGGSCGFVSVKSMRVGWDSKYLGVEEFGEGCLLILNQPKPTLAERISFYEVKRNIHVG